MIDSHLILISLFVVQKSDFPNFYFLPQIACSSYYKTVSIFQMIEVPFRVALYDETPNQEKSR
jgi:hypothetical protein